MIFGTQTARLKKYVDDAIGRMLEKDTRLLESDADESCLCERLAQHMEQVLEDSAYRDYEVDVEYDAGVEGCDFAQKRIGDGMIAADLVVHKRGGQRNSAADNLIAIELRRQNDKEGYGADLAKLKRLTDPRYGCMYKLGLMIVADGGDMFMRNAFVQGREIAPEMIGTVEDDGITVVNKLVRDRVPEVMAARGKYCVCEKLNDEDYARLLDEKLGEELGEYQKNKRLVELADLLEVIYAVAKLRGWSPEDLELARAAKAKKHGSFEKKLFLREVRQKPRVMRVDADDLLGVLAEGVDPFTGEILPEDHVCRRPDVAMALRLAAEIRKKKPARRTRIRAGEPWMAEEEVRLIEEFEAGMTILEMARLHGRTTRAIEARLRRLGKLEK